MAITLAYTEGLTDPSWPVAQRRKATVGFFDRLVGAIGRSSVPPCPGCGANLDGEGFAEERYWCPGCGRLFVVEGGEPVDVKDLRQGDLGDCVWCQSSLNGGTSYLPHEDGSNSRAYIICPSCGGENIREGFGED